MRDSCDVPVAPASIMPRPPAAMVSHLTHLRLFNLRTLLVPKAMTAMWHMEERRARVYRLHPIAPRVLPFGISGSILGTLGQQLISATDGVIGWNPSLDPSLDPSRQHPSDRSGCRIQAYYRAIVVSLLYFPCFKTRYAP